MADLIIINPMLVYVKIAEAQEAQYENLTAHCH